MAYLIIFLILEPLKLEVGNEYNLNNVKEIEVSDEFLTLDKSKINCQNKESLQDCITKKFMNSLSEECKCLPFGIQNYRTVVIYFKNLIC